MRAVENQAGAAALAGVNLDAVATARGRDVASRGLTRRPVPCRAGGAGVERADGVVDDVLRQEVGDPRAIVEAHGDGGLQLVACHTGQPHVAYAERAAA